MKYQYAAVTRKGERKTKNEDRIMIEGNYISNGELQGESEGTLLVVVCDGVGGEAGGDEAASIVSMSFLPLCGIPMSAFDVTSATNNANSAVKELQRCENYNSCMASTIAGIQISNNKYLAFNAGDSRIYTMSEDKLVQLSTDHTKAQKMVDDGRIEFASEAPESMQNTITQYIGGDEAAGKVSINRGELIESEFRFFICSDGVSKNIEEGRLSTMLRQDIPAIEKCRTICNIAIENGSADDLSVVFVSGSA